MKGKELLKNIAREKMPNKEQVRDNCHSKITANVISNGTIKSERPWRKRPALIAMIISVIMLMGATGYYILITQTVFDLDGNAFVQRFFVRNPAIRRQLNEENLARDIFEREFIDSITEPNRLIVINRSAGCGRNNSEVLPIPHFYDYAEWQEFAAMLDDGTIKLPNYIPERFEFEHGVVRFFICTSFDFDALELIRREEYLGNIHEEWYFPKELVNLNNISVVSIHYRCVLTDHRLFFEIVLDALDETAHRTFGGGHNDSRAEISEILQIPQFERNLMLSIDGDESAHWFWGINLLDAPISWISGCWGRDVILEYRSVMYHIGSADITRDEIIRMAESIR